MVTVKPKLANDSAISPFALEFNFDDIRPYYDTEARAVLLQLIEDPLFFKLVHYLWPEMTLNEVREKANTVFSNLDFQLQFMHKAIRTIVSNSSTGLTCNGFENINKNESYLFIANHRDILLDSAILQILLVEHDFSTSEISFGNNLKDKGFITEFGKINRMFTVLREGTSKELYEISRKLSAYIRHTLVDKKTSVWIAQRNGRTKDGFDITQTGLLKMLKMSGMNNFEQNFAQLKIVPLTISYEYEPCDVLKTQEIYLSSLHSKYQKSPGEDLNSIITGITQPKGRIHLAIGEPIIDALGAFDAASNDNDKIKKLAGLIDSRMYADLKVWPINYVAADLLEESCKYESKYTRNDKDGFIAYATNSLMNAEGDKEFLKTQFIKLYANPVYSKQRSQFTPERG